MGLYETLFACAISFSPTVDDIDMQHEFTMIGETICHRTPDMGRTCFPPYCMTEAGSHGPYLEDMTIHLELLAKVEDTSALMVAEVNPKKWTYRTLTIK